MFLHTVKTAFPGYICALYVEEGFIRAASWLMGDLSGHTLNCGAEVGGGGRESITSLATPVADDDDVKGGEVLMCTMRKGSTQ